MNVVDKVITLDCTIQRKPEILAVDLDGEFGMMNVEKGKYYGMDVVGSRIWEIIEKPQTVRNVINILLIEYDIQFEACAKDVAEFIGRLSREELITVT